MLLLAQLLPGVESGRAVTRRFETGDGIKSAGVNQGKVTCRRQGSHDHAGE